MSAYKKHKRIEKLITGYRPVVRARNGLMLGIRQPCVKESYYGLPGLMWIGLPARLGSEKRNPVGPATRREMVPDTFPLIQNVACPLFLSPKEK